MAGHEVNQREVHVWLLLLDLEDLAGVFPSVLAPDERQRAARMRSPLDRARYSVGRACLRAILGGYLARPPADLRFRVEPLGRPVLDPPTDLSFSVAHADAVGLVAVARARAIGVDLEPLSAAGQISDIAARYLPPDRVMAIQAAPAEVRDELWVELWTAVEARAKLDGLGLAELDPIHAAARLDVQLPSVPFVPAPGYLATLVHTGNASNVSFLAFDHAAYLRGNDRASRWSRAR